MITVSDIIAKRKQRWEEKHDLDYDRELVRASVVKILSENSLIEEVRAKPYLLIEVGTPIHNSKGEIVDTQNPLEDDNIDQPGDKWKTLFWV